MSKMNEYAGNSKLRWVFELKAETLRVYLRAAAHFFSWLS
jgi:hypothetical protein